MQERTSDIKIIILLLQLKGCGSKCEHVNCNRYDMNPPEDTFEISVCMNKVKAFFGKHVHYDELPIVNVSASCFLLLKQKY